MNQSLRRSLFSGGAKDIIDTNDDAAELRERRRKSNLQPTETSFNSSTGNVSFREISMSMSTSEALVHYTNCLKLSTENKITVKNAFSLQLIDYMSSMLRKKDSRMENFQVASSTLDASAKIYAARVDRVHGDGLRFATGLGMLNHNNRKDGNAEKDCDNVEVKSKRLLHKKAMRTVVENVESINSLETEKFSCDSGLLYMKFKFGQCCPGDTNFLRRISITDDSCKMQFIPSEMMHSKDPVKISSSLKLFPQLPAINNLSISPYTCEPADMGEEIGFKFKKKENEKENILSLSPDSLCDVMDMTLGDNLDSATHDTYDTQPPDHDSISTVMTVCPPTACRTNRPPDCIFDITKQLSKRQLEYTYFDIERLSLWAGPTHWKLPRITVTRNMSHEKQERKHAKKEVILFIDNVPNFQQHFKRSKYTVLRQRTMETWDPLKLAFEKDVHYSVDCLSKLFLRQCESIEHIIIRSHINCDDNGDVSDYDYNYDNPNDTAEFCPNVMEEPDKLDLSFVSGGIVPPPDVHNPGNLFSQEDGWKMLTPPRKPVNYFSDVSYDAVTSLDFVTSMSKPVSLSHIIKTLPQVMSSDLTSYLNVPIIFNSILHLANEKNLSLKNKDGDGDILITQDPSTEK